MQTGNEDDWGDEQEHGSRDVPAVSLPLVAKMVIALLLIALFQMFQSPSGQQQSSEIAYSQFLTAVDNNRVKSVTITGDRITGTYTDSSTRFSTPYR